MDGNAARAETILRHAPTFQPSLPDASNDAPKAPGDWTHSTAPGALSPLTLLPADHDGLGQAGEESLLGGRSVGSPGDGLALGIAVRTEQQQSGLPTG